MLNIIRACSGRRPYVLPDRYTVEVVKGGGLVKPVGILFIHLTEAQNVPRTDLFSKTDCYARCCQHGSDLTGYHLPADQMHVPTLAIQSCV